MPDNTNKQRGFFGAVAAENCTSLALLDPGVDIGHRPRTAASFIPIRTAPGGIRHPAREAFFETLVAAATA